MVGYSPLKITGNSSGLVQERENFLLPDDAYPVLQNAYVWREKIKRKKGCQLLGRLQRQIGTTNGSGNAVINISPIPIVNTGIVSFKIGTDFFTDPGTTADPATQTLLTNSSGTGTLNRVTGILTITGSIPGTAVMYFPGQPVMGIRTQELPNSADDQTLFFDQTYAYTFNNGTNQFQEYLPGTTWNKHLADVTGTDFFWSTNYWTSNATPSPFSSSNQKLFWVTNNTGSFGALSDPPRITDSNIWVDFFPAIINPGVNDWSKIDATNYLVNWLSMLPFRGRMVTFNTWEGPDAANALHYPNRIRWSTIGNPFIPFSAGPPAKGSWRSDIRGQGGFLDIPTSEDIIAIGFVRDNLVIYCERSTWQLRYTGRSIAPFQIERVNSELGAESPFSAVQFDTSLLGIGDKGVVECDSYKSERIDVKIPDLVFEFNSLNNGVFRVHGIRDFVNRLAYWTFPYYPAYPSQINAVFPNERLVYNYENDSWAIFNDSLTTIGTYQVQSSRTWLNTTIPWIECDFPWIEEINEDPVIVGGNQQGFIEKLDELTTNDISLSIQNITNGSTTVILTIPNHNMSQGFVVEIVGILSTDPFSVLNTGVYGISIVDSNNVEIRTYNTTTDQFSDVVSAIVGNYQGIGYVAIRDNFSITSKKFNFLDEGNSIQLGFIDILMEATEQNSPGAISLFVYLDYDDSSVSNILPDNLINNGSTIDAPDTFFNSIIPTNQNSLSNIEGSKFWQRIFCSTRANFITLQYTFSNAQMAGDEQTKNVQIDAQILWIRKAGRITAGY